MESPAEASFYRKHSLLKIGQDKDERMSGIELKIDVIKISASYIGKIV